MIKRIASILLAAALAVTLAAPQRAFAQDEHAARQPDYSKKGSVAVDIRTAKGNKVAGGELTIYKIAEAVHDDGDHTFVMTEEFAASGLTLDAIEAEETGAPQLAADFAKYVEEKGLSGTAVKVDDNGHADFKDLVLGVYLIVQSEANEEYAPIKPFLVTVPLWDGEKLVYDVNAKPKPGTAIGKAKYDPPIWKLVQDKNNAAHDDDVFKFRMSPADPSYPMPNAGEATYDTETGSLTIEKQGPGEYEFGWMYFGPEHVGKTFSYKVYEVEGDDANYKYDTMIYTMTIEVTQNEQEEILLDVKYFDPTGDEVGQIKFNNIYDSPPPPPDTGQLWWPVPVLVVLGLAMFVYGWITRRKSSEN